MLKSTNNQKLIDAGLKDEHILFYQIWKELTVSKTFDTYQYKSVNMLNGTKELIHDIESYLEGNTYTTHTIDAMCEELSFLLNQDFVMFNVFPSIKKSSFTESNKKARFI